MLGNRSAGGTASHERNVTKLPLLFLSLGIVSAGASCSLMVPLMQKDPLSEQIQHWLTLGLCWVQPQDFFSQAAASSIQESLLESKMHETTHGYRP